ncbi:cardioactive peptide-like [Melitaea cinxia]|uniref:cardioactive peptide-like n=1 Tax=Melitaea cinxia TaxID=113334 RepID=UPI001E2704C5|nr:cardioactive peptide-like [Melitaea cinxia]
MASRGVMLYLTVSLLCLDYCLTNTLLIPYGQRLDDEVILTPLKRPFCNAFTGCGRKRSDLTPAMSSREMFTRRQFADKAAYDSENVIELTRKIMTGAKLWEALQDASAELSRRKQKSYY